MTLALMHESDDGLPVLLSSREEWRKQPRKSFRLLPRALSFAAGARYVRCCRGNDVRHVLDRLRPLLVDLLGHDRVVLFDMLWPPTNPLRFWPVLLQAEVQADIVLASQRNMVAGVLDDWREVRRDEAPGGDDVCGDVVDRAMGWRAEQESSPCGSRGRRC